MVIFGGNGDLTFRKLLPAIYNLMFDGVLPDNFAIVSVGRRGKTDEEYRNELMEAVERHGRNDLAKEKWALLSERIFYREFDFHEDAGYVALKGFLEGLDEKFGTMGNRIYYLAVAPEFFDLISSKLKVHGMVINNGSWQRVVIEKPFGVDLKSAQYLNNVITSIFSEKNTYRIDHYLGKEMLQNIMVIRFANAVFEPLWNSRFIDNIQISSTETVGVESRGGYYEKSGVLKDMLQNHMLQLLSLIAMEPASNSQTEAIRDEKVKILQALTEFTPEAAGENIVRGQYGPGIAGNREVPGYRQENRVSPTSDTETFIAMKLFIDNPRWKGVPFYIRSGKRLARRSTEVVIQFKSPGTDGHFTGVTPNLLVIRIQPKEGVFFQFNAKKPGTGQQIIPVQMDFCQNCRIGYNSPEAYERLIYDVMRGDSTLFTRWDEVEYAWRFTDSIAGSWENATPGFPNYAAGTMGPDEANLLLTKDGRQWWNIDM